MALTDNLVAYWKLEEASGTRNDSHGVNHLTDVNTVTQGAGKLGNAALFTRANSEALSITDNAALSMGDIDFTLALWLYLESIPGTMAIIQKLTTWYNAQEYSILFNNNYLNGLEFNVANGTSGNIVTATNFGTLSTGTWYYVVAWHDSVADTVNIQVNNGTLNSAAWAGGSYDSAAPLEIGRHAASTHYMDGRIDSVGVWKRVLTADERTALYNSGNGLEYPFSTSSYIPRIMRHHFIPSLGVN